MTEYQDIGLKRETIEEVISLVKNKKNISLSSESREKIRKCRAYLENRIESKEELIYGINTGFGSLCNVKIEKEQLSQLQRNLVLSHACGVGEEIPLEISRLIFFLKIKNMCHGYSGVRESLVDRMIELYNADVLPIIYELGSLGASGDLAPLAHLGLTIIGEESCYKSEKKCSFSDLGIPKFQLRAKEGLAILNGTQFSLAYATWTSYEAKKIMAAANMIAALSNDVYDCKKDPFREILHNIRPHQGQINAAKAIRYWRENSILGDREKINVQDPYSFRCVPQVHGASMQALDHVYTVVETELNSTTDNPSIFPEEEIVLTGGNFHAQPLALALDYLCISLSEIGNISERRLYQLINGDRQLPQFLIAKPGLDSGFMIAQYAVASVVSQNKQLCTPASVDSIVSCRGQEDHVSMAANAGTKAYKLVNNVWKILGVEFLAACQALDFRRPMTTSPRMEEIVSAFRKEVPFREEDKYLAGDMHKAEIFIRNLDL